MSKSKVVIRQDEIRKDASWGPYADRIGIARLQTDAYRVLNDVANGRLTPQAGADKIVDLVGAARSAVAKIPLADLYALGTQGRTKDASRTIGELRQEYLDIMQGNNPGRIEAAGRLVQNMLEAGDSLLTAVASMAVRHLDLEDLETTGDTVIDRAGLGVMTKSIDVVSYPGVGIEIKAMTSPVSDKTRESNARAQAAGAVKFGSTVRSLEMMAQRTRSPAMRAGLSAMAAYVSQSGAPGASPELKGAAGILGSKAVSALRKFAKTRAGGPGTPQMQQLSNRIIEQFGQGDMTPERMASVMANVEEYLALSQEGQRRSAFLKTTAGVDQRLVDLAAEASKQEAAGGDTTEARAYMEEASNALAQGDRKRASDYAKMARNAMPRTAQRAKEAASARRSEAGHAARVASIRQRARKALEEYQTGRGNAADPELVSRLSRFDDAWSPGETSEVIRGNTDLAAALADVAADLNRDAGNAREVAVAQQLNELVGKLSELPADQQLALFDQVNEVGAALGDGNLKLAENLLGTLRRNVSVALNNKSREARMAVRRAKFRRNQRVAAPAAMRGLVASAQRLSRRSGVPISPSELSALELEMARRMSAATTVEEQEQVLRDFQEIKGQVSAADQVATENLADELLGSGRDKASATMRTKITSLENRLTELRAASPEHADRIEDSIKRLRQRATEHDDAAGTDRRTVAARAFAAEEAAARAVLAEADPALKQYRAEHGRMARLGMAIALTRGVNAISGIVGSLPGGPGAVGSQFIQSGSQLGGALQNYGANRFINTPAGFKDLLGWGAFAGGTVVSALAGLGTALYNRGSGVLQRGAVLGDRGRGILPSLMALHPSRQAHPFDPPSQGLQSSRFTRGDYLASALVQEGHDIEEAMRLGARYDSELDTGGNLARLDLLVPGGRVEDKEAAGMNPGSLSEYFRKKLLVETRRRTGGLVSPENLYTAMGASPVGELGTVFHRPNPLARKRVSPLYAADYASDTYTLEADSLDAMTSEAIAAAEYAVRRGRSVSSIAGISSLKAMGRIRGLRGLAPLTGTQGLGYIGDARDTALDELVRGLQPAALAGYRADITGDIVTAHWARRAGVHPTVASQAILRGADAATASARRYAGGFSNVLDVAGDVMAYERSTTGDPADVARKRLEISESERMRYAAKNLDREAVLWNLQERGMSPEDAAKLLEAAESAGTGAAGPRDEPTSFFDEISRLATGKSAAEYVAAENEKNLTEAEKELRVAARMDEASARFARSVDQFGTAVMSIFS